ncbi:MAG: TetR/AcrR family transcriptional regulator [Flavobacteriales bacterium]|nr:TetR/AcrR family transcriptional regulator [Flavobacteriales bacterium]
MIRSEKTRNFIIEKTAAIFNKKGYTGTYLSDLTEATGLSKGSIYGNFKDKNEVAVEAFKCNYQRQAGDVYSKMEQIERSDEKLLSLLNHFKTEYIPIFKNGGCAILNTAIDADDGNESLKLEVNNALKNWRSKTEEILKEGIQKEEIKEIDVRHFTNKMIALIEGSILLAKTLDEPQILLQNISSLESDIKKLRKE